MEDEGRRERIVQMGQRVQGFAEEIESAHKIGFGPGHIDDPWTIAAQRELLPVYVRSLPERYRCAFALHARGVADCLASEACPPGAQLEWHRLAMYLRAVSDVIRKPSGDDAQHDCRSHPGWAAEASGEATPTVMRFDLLAEKYSCAGAASLRHIGRTVRECAEPASSSPLTADERQWLARLAEGVPVVRIASDSFVSKRTLDRRLRDSWNRLEVDGRTDGIALCTERGWISLIGDCQPQLGIPKRTPPLSAASA